MKPDSLSLQRYHAPCGELLLGEWHGQLCLCEWVEKDADSTSSLSNLQVQLGARLRRIPSALTRKAASMLDEYFAGRRQTFDRMPLFISGSAFRVRVWSQLLELPYGTTITYGELAERLGNGKLIRAAAAACGENPIAIFVPCHRVIGKNSHLVGYGGGLAVKQYLLDLEHHQPHLHFLR